MGSTFDKMAAGLGNALKAHMGEAIRYKPKGGELREITAVIIRNPQAPGGTDRSTRLEHRLEALIPMSEAATITEGGDQVQLLKRLTDQSLTTYTIKTILDQVGGQWHVALN